MSTSDKQVAVKNVFQQHLYNYYNNNNNTIILYYDLRSKILGRFSCASEI